MAAFDCSGNLDFVLESAKTPRASRAPRVHEVLSLVRFSNCPIGILTNCQVASSSVSHSPAPWSASPRVLLLDEPLSSLDPELRATLRDELARLQRALSVTMVYVTHDTEDVAVLADRVVEMRAGHIVSISKSQDKEERA